MADKFKTLEYNFDETNFPAKYEAKGFKLNGELIPNKGDDSAEEMLWFYAASKNRNGIDDNFNANFFMDLKPRLTPNQQKLSFPKDFQKVIDEMFNMNEAKKEAKKARSKEEKDAEKKLKESLKEKYGYAIVDGKKQPLGAYMIEPPGILFSRGAPKIHGHWKYRVQPEDIIINWCSDKPAPKAPVGHHWKEVVANRKAFQIVKYEVDTGHIVTGPKKILFAAKADNKKDSDKKKFEKALKLIKNWDKMEAHIEKGLKSKDKKIQEAALVAWLIKETSIRVGSYDTKGTDFENGVVGASTLKVENIILSKED